MFQINLNEILKQAKKYWPHSLAVILIFLLIGQCNNATVANNALEKTEQKYEQVSSDLRIAIRRTEDALKSNKETRIQLAKADAKIYTIEQEKKNLADQIAILQSKGEGKKSDAKKYDNPAFAKYFGQRYNEMQKAVATAEGVTLKTGLPLKVVNDLIDGDVAKAELKLTRKMLEKEFEKSNELTGKITILEKDNNNLSIELKENLTLLSESQKLADEQNKLINKLDTKRKINKYLLPAGVIAGFIGGILIAK